MNRRTATILFATVVLFGTDFSHADDPEAGVADGNASIPIKVFNIKNFGAVGNGVAIETKAVQNAIDACHDAGGGVVRVPAGDFQIGTIVLKSNITLSLDHGANLLGSTNTDDYTTEGLDDPREGGPHCLIYANGATNVAIEGLGVIDGRGTAENFPRSLSRYLVRPGNY